MIPVAKTRETAAEWKLSSPSVIPSTVIFVASSILLFFGMSTLPSSYDEGITLTAAMRVAAGQIPHRDFYAIYGPAQFFSLAGLFKLFGESLFIERALYAIFAGLIVSSMFYISSAYCRRAIAAWAATTTFIWMFGLGAVSGSAIIPFSLLSMVGSAVLLPMFLEKISTKRLLVAGGLAGMATLFRYDAGIAMLGIQACVIGFALYLQVTGFSKWLKESIQAFLFYLAGFAVLTVLLALYYLSVASARDFMNDIILYPSKYYRRGRALPFPGIHFKTIDYLVVYVPIIIAAISIYIGVTGCLRVRRQEESRAGASGKDMVWYGLLIAFGLLSFVMYLKGLVRISPAQMYLSILPSILLVAVLFEHRAAFRRPLALSVQWLLIFSIAFAGLEAVRQIRSLDKQHSWVPAELYAQSRGTLSPALEAWCHSTNPLTRGLCFLPSIDRIETIEFIDSHTTPDQMLFVGNTRQDKVIANDNLLYFATQRLPATHWSHYDPLLQNREDIQIQMVHELEAAKPPYVVLDSEYEGANEPNESSRSTGVMLLDDYIHSHYRWVQATGVLSIWQRLPEN